MLPPLLKALRPHQWVKNVFVLAPLIFAEQALSTTHLAKALLAFALFSALSGCVYLLNDMADIERDRLHPTKKHRPIASGALPLPTARLALVTLLTLSLATAYFALNPLFFALGLGYFSLNVAYSFWLKHLPFIDVSAIASGFLLRIVAGAAALRVPITGWIVGTTFLLALTLALGKRQHELAHAGQSGAAQRKVLGRYSARHLRWAMGLSALATFAAYSAYVLWGAPVGHLFVPQDMAPTLPLVALGLGRFVQLTAAKTGAESPTDRMLKDKPILILGALWLLAVLLIIY